ncbi:MaoC family dehydratase [Microbacterium saperdae]|uniref:Acyl dehydratase n=1 Tax=Microbacterium saperdae TaxID=69368 RepID=A0A543BLA3_9MICO|nr:MaoC family dehydratase [Microbacterium saperdae]TQL85609.1 acyl dehydratase [Microbacterium saperdae]GGM62297.1 MaoC family dehydratase [Microbacterium saperdae]
MSVRMIDGVRELRTLVGSELGVSPWLEVAQDRVDAFADITEDRQWIHVDPEMAADGPFGGTVAHGYLTLALLPTLAARTYRVDDISAVVNYGLERVRFPRPIRVGEHIRDRITLASMGEFRAGARLVIDHYVEVRGSTSPACVAQTVSLLASAGGDS